MQQVLALFTLFTPRERRRALALLVVAIAMAIVETLGVASVMPFLAVLGNQGLIDTNPYLAAIYHAGGFATHQAFLFALGVATLAVVVGAAFFRAGAQYAVFRFANMRRYSISVRMFRHYLGQPYEFFLNRNSADVAARVLSEVDQVVDSWIMPGVQMVAYTIVVVMLVGLLVVVDPIVAAIVVVVVGGFYAAIYAINRRILLRTGRERARANRQRFGTAVEAFGGIKEIKLFGREQDYFKRFQEPAYAYARYKASNDTVALVPRYFIEAVAFGGVLMLALGMMMAGRDLGTVLPILGLYALAGYRLLPAAQAVYAGITRIRFNAAAVDAVIGDLKTPSEPLAGPAAAIPFHRSIRLEDVTYQYPSAHQPALIGFDLEIAAGSAIGFVGATGAGKTTAADLILGLLAPTSGRILIDGVPLTAENRRGWQANLGYVPQAIFLADASIAQNIAFGVPAEMIDQAAVERAARAANVHDFVATALPKGYETEVGERGVRLSGGQRQRIGIARALYRDPPVLVFDEATSALDNATEAAVMEAVGRLHGDKTIIIIAHRLSTTRGCDRIFTFAGGSVSEDLEPRLLWRAAQA